MEKVSIIVPVYNVEKYLERCLESLINQTYRNIEILIVNDGSTDNSKKICEKYKEMDSRIRLINKKNQGLGMARNTGLEYITGKYVLFVDSDDYVERNLVELVYKIAEENNCDFVRFHNYREDITTGEKKIRKSPLEEGFYSKEDIKQKILLPIIGVLPNQTGNDFVGMSVWRNLYRASVIRKENLKFVSEREFISEDVIFNISFFDVSSRAYVINIPLYHYIVNDNSLTAIYKKDRFDKEVIMYKKIESIVKEKNFSDDSLVRASRTFLDRTRMCLRQEFSRKNISLKDQRQSIIKICSNEMLTDIINIYPLKKMNIEYRFILFLIKNKMYIAMKILFEVFKKI